VARSVRDDLNIGVWTIDMRLQDKGDFFEALGEATGVLKDWIEDGDVRETYCQITAFYRLDTYGGFNKVQSILIPHSWAYGYGSAYVEGSM
jgi:hypothetical protein